MRMSIAVGIVFPVVLNSGCTPSTTKTAGSDPGAIASCGSIASCIAERPDEFGGHRPVVPPSSDSRLGKYIEAEPSEGRVRTSTVSCFTASPTESRGLDLLEVKYRADSEFVAEVQAAGIFSVGGALDNANTVTLRLESMALRKTELGVPNPVACDLDTGGPWEIVTEEVVAKRVLVGKATNTGISGKAGLQLANTPIQAETKGSWKASDSGAIEGTDIVVSVATTSVVVTTSNAEHELGEELTGEKFFAFPKPFDGGVTVKKLNTADGIKLDWLVSGGAQDILANTALPKLADGAEDRLCTVGRVATVTPGERCFIVPGPNAVLAVWYAEADAGQGAKTLKLYYKAYRAAPIPPQATPDSATQAGSSPAASE